MHWVDQPVPAWARLVRAPNPGPMTLEGTNSWVLRSTPGEPAVVVDPGPDDPDHLHALAECGPIAVVLVTHGHSDHVGGVEKFLTLTGASVPRLEPGVPTTLAGLRITALATPGHSADSVCYLVEGDGQRAMLTGDTILGRGTTVVAWPDGDLGDYLDSLRRLADFAGVPVLPGHGPVLPDCAAVAEAYLAHRRERLAQVEAALSDGATTPAEVVARVYADVDPALRQAAEWTVRAHMAYLRARRESPPGRSPLDSL